MTMPALAPADPLSSVSQDVGLGDVTDRETRAGLEAMYGSAFPLLQTDPSDDDWKTWAEALWERHTASVQSRLHLVQRNRLFRIGKQWITSLGALGPWREPERPRDVARVVENMIQPALDQRVQLITEQRPGFRVRPESHNPAALKRAEAQQIALEYQWDQQRMDRVLKELAYWAGTDAVCFLELFWDTNAGVWYDGLNAPLGDIRPRIRRIEQVRVSADARATKRPWYAVLRESMPLASAAVEYGVEAAGKMSTDKPENRTNLGSIPVQRLGYLLPEEEELFREQDLVDRIVVYCDKSEYLKNGLTLIVVGGTVQFVGPLVCGKVPLIRMTDGTTDPAYLPAAIMDGWIDSQMRINAVKSKWVENVRLNAGPRLIGKENSIVGETLVGGTMSVISVKGMGAINESVRPLQGFSLAEDALALLQSEIKHFEDISGYSATSRGQFSEDQSGRAILAIREALERIFAPPINAAAEAMTDWAEVSLAWMRWGYDLPRAVAVEGGNRPDLARQLQAQDFDGISDVHIDPETMMPMPRSLRLFLIKDMAQMGLMSPQETRRRMPFAWIRDMGSPDEDQEARARRCAEALRSGQQLPILWVDNEAIHQDVLERELILPDDTPPQIRAAAMDRWNRLGMQAGMKGGMMAPEPAGPQAKPPGPQQPGMGPQQQPFAGTNPGMAAGQSPVPGTPGAATMNAPGQSTDASAASREFDARMPS